MAYSRNRLHLSRTLIQAELIESKFTFKTLEALYACTDSAVKSALRAYISVEIRQVTRTSRITFVIGSFVDYYAFARVITHIALLAAF